MKKIPKFLLLFIGILIGTVFSAETTVHAEENRSTEFKYLFLYQYDGEFMEYENGLEGTDGRIHYNQITLNSRNFFHNLDLIDEKEHIYYVKNLYSNLIVRNKIIFTGALKSSTARITSITNPVNEMENSPLPELEIDTSTGYYIPEGDESIQIIPEGNNVFTSSPGSLENKVWPLYYNITVEDGNLKTTYKVLIDFFYPQNCSWNRNSIITLYDGTDGKQEKLDERYQFAQEEKNSLIYGVEPLYETRTIPDIISGGTREQEFVTTAAMGDINKYSLPEGVESIKISRLSNESMPEGGNAFAPNLEPLYITDGGPRIDINQNSYFYYRQKTYCIQINDGEWIEMDDGKVSPELKLKQGWNIISIVSMSKDWMKNPKRLMPNNDRTARSRILLIYKGDSSDYEIKNESKNTEISSIEIFKAVPEFKDAKELFAQYDVYEKETTFGTKEKWVDLYTSSPCIWMKVFRDDQSSSVTVEGAQISYGGFYMELDPEKQDEIPIIVTSASGEKQSGKLHINWISTDTKLQKLYPEKGGAFTENYDKDKTLYYLKKDDSDIITLKYQGSPNTTTEVYVERQKKTEVSDDAIYSIDLPASGHNVQFKISAPNGDTNTYTVAVERTEKGISEKTRNRAKAMMDKILNGGYIKEIQEKQPVDTYWGTFRAASLGEEYLDGTLAGDVTSYNYTQATSYAVTILQLVMSGENPYDYLGVNYVEKLLDLGPAYFGPYANNIWALLALDAAGYPANNVLLKNVLSQAYNTGFDLDMRGWALAALSSHLEEESFKEKVDLAVETIKNTQLAVPTEMNGYEVTGAFENFYYTNRNINSHACVVSGLTALGIDVGSEEWQVDGLNGLVDGVSLFESYQQEDGKLLRTPAEKNAGYNKDGVIAIGDLYNGSNVWQRYALTNERYGELLSTAEKLLASDIEDDELKNALSEAYEAAKEYASEEEGLNSHGIEFYALQEAVYAINGEKPDVFQGTAEEREQVRSLNDMISKLPKSDSVTYESREKILAAQSAYEALNGDARLEHYVTNYRILEKDYDYVNKIDNFLDAMKEVKKVDLSKTAKVEAARKAYEMLNDMQKAEAAVVEKYKILLDAEKIIEASRTADNVVAVIDTLGYITTLDSRESIEGARASYEALDDEQKTYVTNYEVLTTAEEELKRLEALEQAKEQASEVTELIDLIGTVDHNSGDRIEEAEKAYNDLPEGETRQLVGNLTDLLEARRLYDNLTAEEEREYVAKQAKYYIDQIGEAFVNGYDDIVAEDETAIREAVKIARDFYDTNITKNFPEAAPYVTNYAYLIHVESLLQIYKWKMLDEEITAQDFISKVNEITTSFGLSSEADISISFAMYNALSEEDIVDEDVKAAYAQLSQRQEEWQMLKENYTDIQELERKIIALGTIGADSKLELEEAAALYEELEETMISYVDQTLINKLQEAVGQCKKLSEEQEKYQAIITQIDEIGVVTLDSSEAVKNARKAYDELQEKKYITNYATLLQAEKELLELQKEEEDMPIASTVIKRIDDLGTVQLKDEYKVISARDAYDSLTATQKKCVKNLSVLEAAEKRLESLKNATITMEPEKQSVELGKTGFVKAVPSVADAVIMWKVSDTTVLTLDESSGKIVGKNAGKARITATLENGRQAICEVTVIKPAVSSDSAAVTSLNRSKLTLYTKGTGKTATLKLTYLGQTIKGSQIKWKSNKASVVKVSSSGKVTAKKKGTAKITATYKGQSFTCKVTVKTPTLKLNKTKVVLHLKKAKTYTLKATANGKLVSGKKVEWSSSNKRIATVSKSGKVTAKRKGTVKITAKINGKKVTTKVTVKE